MSQPAEFVSSLWVPHLRVLLPRSAYAMLDRSLTGSGLETFAFGVGVSARAWRRGSSICLWNRMNGLNPGVYGGLFLCVPGGFARYYCSFAFLIHLARSRKPEKAARRRPPESTGPFLGSEESGSPPPRCRPPISAISSIS